MTTKVKGIFLLLLGHSNKEIIDFMVMSVVCSQKEFNGELFMAGTAYQR